MSLQGISEDHYARTVYGSEPHTFTHENVGTRYLVVASARWSIRLIRKI